MFAFRTRRKAAVARRDGTAIAMSTNLDYNQPNSVDQASCTLL